MVFSGFDFLLSGDSVPRLRSLLFTVVIRFVFGNLQMFDCILYFMLFAFFWVAMGQRFFWDQIVKHKPCNACCPKISSSGDPIPGANATRFSEADYCSSNPC